MMWRAVLKINPKRIDRIEIINQYYQKGELSVGGIINFISKDNDFGGFEFKNSSLVINYMFLNETYSFLKSLLQMIKFQILVQHYIGTLVQK